MTVFIWNDFTSRSLNAKRDFEPDVFHCEKSLRSAFTLEF